MTTSSLDLVKGSQAALPDPAVVKAAAVALKAETKAAEKAAKDAAKKAEKLANSQAKGAAAAIATAPATEVAVVKTSIVTKKAVATGEVLAPDILTDTVHEVENMTEVQAGNAVKALTDTSDFNSFKLGGVLSVIMQNKWFGTYPDFKSYIEGEHGFHIRKAQYLMSLYNGLCDLGLPWSDLKKVGWTKLRELLPVIDKDNAASWINKASGDDMTVIKLGALVKAAQKNAEAGNDSGAGTHVATVHKGFKLHPDQLETVMAGINKAKTASGTESDSVALEFMALDWLGATPKAPASSDLSGAATHLDTPEEKVKAMTDKSFKAYMLKIGLEAACNALGEAFPDAEVSVAI
jgi:hypothetical protein